MKQAASNPESGATHRAQAPARKQGSQTLLRGLQLIEEVARGTVPLAQLSEQMGLTRSTTHRLASALVEARYLVFLPREGYGLGPKLLELGALAEAQIDLVQIARPVLEGLSGDTGDTVHLGRRNGDRVLYIHKQPGARRVEISSRVGELQPLTSTGLGKALLLGERVEEWRRLFAIERELGENRSEGAGWLARMADYAERGVAFDLEENEDRIRCVAAPIRDAAGRIVAAVSVSSAAQYMDDARMDALAPMVAAATVRIGESLGHEAGRRNRETDR